MAIRTRQPLPPTLVSSSARRTLRSISVRSVTKFSALFAATISVVVLIASGVLFLIAQNTGAVRGFENLLHHSGYPHFHVVGTTVLEAVCILTVVGAITWTVLTALAAWVFNLVSGAVGGIEVSVRE